MADLKVSYRLCWGESVVPLELASLEFLNLHNLADLGDEEPQGFLLVQFKSTMARPWIERALGLGSRWWV